MGDPTPLQPNGVDDLPIIIVGAGPVGLLIALCLAQNGIKTLVLEAHSSLLPTTRAIVYMPVVIPILKKLGIFDRVEKEAYLNRKGVVWRNIEGEPLGQLHLSDDEEGFGGVLLLGQAKMTAMILEELKRYDSVEVRFGTRCVGIENTADGQAVQVMVHRKGYAETDGLLQGRYLIGTDGANSTVRRMLCVPFDGFTYGGWNLIGCDVVCDIEKEMGWTPLNFIVDPESFCVIAFSGQDEEGRHRDSANGLWRFAYPEPPSLSMSNEDVMKRANERIPVWLKKGVEHKVIRAEPYVLHQRVARQARKGNIMLAGDALHSNNPMGGLGLTSGICDAFAYGNALVQVIKHAGPDSLLTSCADSRRKTWIDVTDKLSQANLKRMYDFDPETAAARTGFFKKLKDEPAFHKIVRGGFDKLLGESFERLQEEQS